MKCLPLRAVKCNKDMKKAYKLTPENRYLSTFFKGVTVDEEKETLWSEQDLAGLGCEEIQISIPSKKAYRYSSYCVIITFLLGYVLLWQAIAVLAIFPNAQLKNWTWTLKKRLEAAFGAFVIQSPLEILFWR